MPKQMWLVVALLALCTNVFAAAYDDIVNDMNALLNSHAAYAQSIILATNDQGNAIYGMKIENPNVFARAGEKPAYLVVGAHHGNERKSADIAVKFAEKIINRMINNDAVLSKYVFYVIPVLNIGGFNANRRGEYDSHGTYVDPNRDYPDPCVSDSYYQLASTSALAHFCQSYNIIGAVTVHGTIGTFTYPWGIYTSNYHTADDATFANAASYSVQANHYRTGTHGGEIYPAAGAFEDWAYADHGIWSMLLEYGYSVNIDNDAECMVRFFEKVPTTRSNQHTHNPANCTGKVRNPASRP